MVKSNVIIHTLLFTFVLTFAIIVMILGFRTGGTVAYKSTEPVSHDMEVSAGNLDETTQTVHAFFNFLHCF